MAPTTDGLTSLWRRVHPALAKRVVCMSNPLARQSLCMYRRWRRGCRTTKPWRCITVLPWPCWALHACWLTILCSRQLQTIRNSIHWPTQHTHRMASWSIDNPLEGKEPYPWQKALTDRLAQTPHDRVMWVGHGEQVGVTTYLKWLAHKTAKSAEDKDLVMFLNEDAKLKDIEKYFLALKKGKRAPPSVVVFEYKAARAGEKAKAKCYAGMNFVKGGHAYDGLGDMFCWQTPHVLVFHKNCNASEVEEVHGALGKHKVEALCIGEDKTLSDWPVTSFA